MTISDEEYARFVAYGLGNGTGEPGKVWDLLKFANRAAEEIRDLRVELDTLEDDLRDAHNEIEDLEFELSEALDADKGDDE
jgi:hypothetical protein